MRAPLSVRINDGVTDRLITKYVHDLKFRKTAPGGNHAASMTLRLPRDTFPKLGPADSVYIYDGRTGLPLWDGYTDNPGAVDGASGEGFELSAMGGILLASDESRGLVYLDRDLGTWFRHEASAASASADAGADPSGVVTTTGLLCQFNPGQPITTGARAQISYFVYQATGMEFGAIAVSSLDGKTDANYDVLLAWNGAGGSGTAPLGAYNSNNTAFAKFVGDALAPVAGTDRIHLRFTRSAGGATTIADDNTWVFFHTIAMLGRRMDRNGNLLTGAADLITTDYVLASWVVEDLLGRMLVLCDPTTAIVDTTAEQIDQLAYLDGATPSQVFEDLYLHEPDFYWGIGERLPNGLHRFWYRQWPTDVRYEISTRDGYTAPGGDDDLCNRIAVYWTDTKGIKQTTIRGSYVPELGNKSPVLSGALDPTFVGRIRDAEPVTLPEGRGSQTNAERIGDEVLASKAASAKAATATVRRPISDLMTGKQTMPWEIEPGYPVRVRETGDVLRLTEMEYVDSDGASTLQLGEPLMTDDQRIARLERQR